MANEWISVNDRLPEHSDLDMQYLTVAERGRIDILYYYDEPEQCYKDEDFDGPGFYSEDDDFNEWGEYLGECNRRHEVTHWMPLPEIPELWPEIPEMKGE